jgi:hypothetical protein
MVWKLECIIDLLVDGRKLNVKENTLISLLLIFCTNYLSIKLYI